MIAPEGQYQPFWIWPATFSGIGLIGLVFWALGRLMKRYFPSARKVYSAGGNALMRVDAILQPSRQHVIEAREREDEEQDDSGELR
jgi:hypothetical protein